MERRIYHQALSSGSLGLEPLDPFQVIDPLATENSNMAIENIDFFVTRKNHEEDKEDGWVNIDTEEINIFDKRLVKEDLD